MNPARSSASLARSAHRFRVSSSHSRLDSVLVFFAPPFSGSLVLARLNHVAASRSWPSRPRSEIIR